MKLVFRTFLYLQILFLLLSCESKPSEPDMKGNLTTFLPPLSTITPSPIIILTETPIPTQSLVPSMTISTPTSISVITPTTTPTPSLTPPPTLEPEKAEEAIKTLFKEEVDCQSICFWGIIPGQTTFGVANNVFTRLGLSLQRTSVRGNQEIYWTDFEFRSGLSINLILFVQDGIVTYIEPHVSPEKNTTGDSREWSIFSPDTIIKNHGLPSKVDFFVCRSEHNQCYSMRFYYDELDLIIEYYGQRGPYLTVCPLQDQYEIVRIWMGPNPNHPPLGGVPLETATTMTMEEFAELLTGGTGNACFRLINENIP